MPTLSTLCITGKLECDSSATFQLQKMVSDLVILKIQSGGSDLQCEQNVEIGIESSVKK